MEVQLERRRGSDEDSVIANRRTKADTSSLVAPASMRSECARALGPLLVSFTLKQAEARCR